MKLLSALTLNDIVYYPIFVLQFSLIDKPVKLQQIVKMSVQLKKEKSKTL